MEKFRFDEIWLIKDDQPCPCPFNPGILRQEQKVLSGQQPKFIVDRLVCNKACPFMQSAIKKDDLTNVETKGYLLTCARIPKFIQVAENK